MLWEVRREGESWEFRRTTLGRMVAAAWWAVLAVPIAVVGGVLFFGSDVLGRRAAGVDVPWDLTLAVAVFAGFAAFLAFVARLLRYRRWIVDREADTIALSQRRAFGDPRVVEVPLAELSEVVLRDRALKKELVLRFADDSEEVMAASTLSASSIRSVRDGLAEALDGTGTSVDGSVGE